MTAESRPSPTRTPWFYAISPAYSGVYEVLTQSEFSMTRYAFYSVERRKWEPSCWEIHNAANVATSGISVTSHMPYAWRGLRENPDDTVLVKLRGLPPDVVRFIKRNGAEVIESTLKQALLQGLR